MLSSKFVAESIPTEMASCRRGRRDSSAPAVLQVQRSRRTYLTNGKMAETTDELLLVERVGGLLHATNDSHLLVPLEEVLLGDLDVEAGSVRPVPVEGVLMELDRERLGVRRVLVELRGVRGRLDRARRREGL